MSIPTARRALATAIAGISLVACAASPVSPMPSVPSTPSDVGPTPHASTIGSVPATTAATPTPSLSASALSERITGDTLEAHLVELQAIAGVPGVDGAGSRATGTAAFERSVDYVTSVLVSAGYEVARQPFEAGTTTSWNVVAERAGSNDGVLVLGAHLDSVAAGPGINDNASGVSALLAIAAALADLPAPSVTVRFAFWGAEEGGPFGSRSHVDALSAAEISAIRAYLNFDMLASTNGVTFVYDEPGASPGSEAITNVVSGYFDRRGLPWEPIDLAGDSDHGPFTAAGVPTGGLFSGGFEPVTDAQATRHGSVAGEPADPCSHAACDTIDNVDLARLALMTDAIASILVTLAADAR